MEEEDDLSGLWALWETRSPMLLLFVQDGNCVHVVTASRDR